METIEVYTDGACSGNPGPGGWGAVLIWQDREKKISGYEPTTTNNRMELTGAIEALKAIKKKLPIILYTDSMYVRDGITVWMPKWLKTNWKNGKVKNIDLWQELYVQAQKHDIQWRWVKGHAGHRYNEMADQLACDEIKKTGGIYESRFWV